MCEGSHTLRVKLPLPASGKPPVGQGSATYGDAPVIVYKGPAVPVAEGEGATTEDEDEDEVDLWRSGVPMGMDPVSRGVPKEVLQRLTGGLPPWCRVW